MMCASGTLLITSFGPFPGVEDNPSALLLDALLDSWRAAGVPGAMAVESHLLPTQYDAVTDWIDERFARDTPDLFLMLGYSSIADRLKIERRASNLCAPHLADASGFCPPATKADVRYLPATLPIGRITGALDDSDIDYALSDDCGEYVCNHIYYQVQERLTRIAASTMSGFLHLPPIDFGDGRIVPPGTHRERPVGELVRALTLIVDRCAAEIARC